MNALAPKQFACRPKQAMNIPCKAPWTPLAKVIENNFLFKLITQSFQLTMNALYGFVSQKVVIVQIQINSHEINLSLFL